MATAIGVGVIGHDQAAVVAAHREVDVAGVAFALVVLGHEVSAMPSWAAISLAPVL